MKRVSERQITKDDLEDSSEESPSTQPQQRDFQRAAPEVIAKRKIIKVRRSIKPNNNTQPATTSTPAANPFANFAATAKNNNDPVHNDDSNNTNAKTSSNPFAILAKSTSQNKPDIVNSKDPDSKPPLKRTRVEEGINGQKDGKEEEKEEEEEKENDHQPPSKRNKQVKENGTNGENVDGQEKVDQVVDKDKEKEKSKEEDKKDGEKKDEKERQLLSDDAKKEEKSKVDEKEADEKPEQVKEKEDVKSPQVDKVSEQNNDKKEEGAKEQNDHKQEEEAKEQKGDQKDGKGKEQHDTKEDEKDQVDKKDNGTEEKKTVENPEKVSIFGSSKSITFGGIGGSTPILSFASAANATFGNTNTFGIVKSSTLNVNNNEQQKTIGNGNDKKECFKEEKTISGEEGEEDLFRNRAKLYVLEGKGANARWKERGVGSLKIKRNKESGDGRLLMRTEATLRVVLNAALFESFKIDYATERSIRIQVFDVSDLSNTDDKPTSKCFLIRFSTKDMVKSFEDVINQWKNNNKSK